MRNPLVLNPLWRLEFDSKFCTTAVLETSSNKKTWPKKSRNRPPGCETYASVTDLPSCCHDVLQLFFDVLFKIETLFSNNDALLSYDCCSHACYIATLCCAALKDLCVSTPDVHFFASGIAEGNPGKPFQTGPQGIRTHKKCCQGHQYIVKKKSKIIRPPLSVN